MYLTFLKFNKKSHWDVEPNEELNTILFQISAGQSHGQWKHVMWCKCQPVFVSRCVSLCDPLKESSRSQDSWSSFLTKLRTLLLMSFTRNLGRFEDDMRTLREKRTEPGWSFCDYFMVQVCDWPRELSVTAVGLFFRSVICVLIRRSWRSCSRCCSSLRTLWSSMMN